MNKITTSYMGICPVAYLFCPDSKKSEVFMGICERDFSICGVYKEVHKFVKEASSKVDTEFRLEQPLANWGGEF